ncbi:hypothetical protein DVJ83_06915 [Deinococcus wulumuqiensis]|uniref:Uncharacterized protein n=1 Tax=Deinococcus wulumuqiensis TaxID=980427 RepID=A0A345IGW8_9DEIO|nr:hypothetical protein DVJ83_06915 [Deinococcus wulumuqiensis]
MQKLAREHGIRYGFCFIPAQSGLYSWEGAACASISPNPYFFLLASALLRSFASRIESETTRFNRNPYEYGTEPRYKPGNLPVMQKKNPRPRRESFGANAQT